MGKDRRIIRGTIAAYSFEGPTHLIVDDGQFTNAWRVTRFVVTTQDLGSTQAGARDCFGVLTTHPAAIPEPTGNNVWWTWEDRRQFAWAAMSMDGDSQVDNRFELVDPSHVIVRDMYVAISAQTAFSSTMFNYYIEVERVELTETQAVMAIIQEENQSA